MKFRKKPVVIEAVQFCAGEVDGAFDAHIRSGKMRLSEDGTLLIQTLEGVMEAKPGDWIITGVKGEFYPCKPDIFAATYENAAAPALPDAQAEGHDAWRKMYASLHKTLAPAVDFCQLNKDRFNIPLGDDIVTHIVRLFLSAYTSTPGAALSAAKPVTSPDALSHLRRYSVSSVDSLYDDVNGDLVYLRDVLAAVSAAAGDDTERLDFLIDERAFIAPIGDQFRLEWPYDYVEQSEIFSTPREAIDAAIAAASKGDAQ